MNEKFKTQGDPVHFAYKLNILLSVSLSLGCNSSSTYKIVKPCGRFSYSVILINLFRYAVTLCKLLTNVES